MPRSSIRLFALACLLPLASAGAQEKDRIRQLLSGEKASLVFSPHGGYSPRNYLKRFQTQTGEQRWATQNGLLAELIRRAPRGSKVLLGAFRLDEKEVLDACFSAAKSGVTVKLWLKGPPGLDYMIPGHQKIAARANEYLRERKQQGKEAEWGDFQVQIGTAAQMSAYGKINDMHEKFGVIAVSETHGPGLNHGFLGTSNIGASSDTSHNEHRVFFCDNPGATVRLWGEFARLWKFLGKCETRVGGDPAGASNETPEPLEPRIALPGGGFAQEDPALQFRFTYEKVGGGFHRISQDFIAAIGEAKSLQAGETVWVAQFGFAIPSISRALLKAAQQSPQVQFRIMVHMAEGDTSGVEELATAGLANLKVAVKWDSNKLKLEAGQRPGVPGPTDPGPPLLHHKALVVGSRLMVTGSYNFFGDADDQGENVVIARANLDPALAELLADSRAEFQAMWDSPVMFPAEQLFGADGLYEQVQEASEQDGFLDLLNALTGSPQTAEQLKQAANLQVDLPTVEKWLALLQRFRFAERQGAGWIKAGSPDARAFQDKERVRQEAEQEPPPPPPAADTVTGVVTLTSGRLELVQGGERWTLAPSAVTTELGLLLGAEATVQGELTAPAPGAPGKVVPARLVAPTREELLGTVAQAAAGPTFAPTGGQPLATLGPAASLLGKAGPDPVKLSGYRTSQGLVVVSVEALVLKDEEATYSFVPVGKVKKGERVWLSKLHRNGQVALVELSAARGYVPIGSLAIGKKPATTGMVDTLPDDGN